MSTESSFSYELDPELDAELAAARRRHAGETETVFPNLQVAASELTPEAQAYFNRELGNIAREWSLYSQAPGLKDMTGIDNLAAYFEQATQANPHLMKTVERLTTAKAALTQSLEENGDGENIGETMELVAVPWQYFSTIRPANLQASIAAARNAAGADGVLSEVFAEQLVQGIQEEKTHFYRVRGSDHSTWYSAMQYLSMKLAKDGPWGLMLMQTSGTPGAASLTGKAPLELANRFDVYPQIAGQPVGAMGIYEALALSLQVGQRLPIDRENVGSLLLANVFRGEPDDEGSVYYVPTMWAQDQGDHTSLDWGAHREAAATSKLQPRLAVA